jgi:hypothetical protein
MGFQQNFHINSIFLGHNKYICGRFRGHMDTINTSAQSGGLKNEVKREYEGPNRGDDVLV